jgi:hypothetical protein
MPTRAENIEARLDAIAACLAGLTPYATPDIPNATGGVGENVDYVGYRNSLLTEMAVLQKALSAAEVFEVTSEMSA